MESLTLIREESDLQGKGAYMRDNIQQGSTNSEDSRTSVVNFLSEPSIKGAMRSYAFQHPLTILPLALSVLALIVYLVFPPFLGPIWAIILFIVFGLVALGTYVMRYVTGFDQLYEMISRQRMALVHQETQEQAELEKLRETLQTGFAHINTNEGPQGA